MNVVISGIEDLNGVYPVNTSLSKREESVFWHVAGRRWTDPAPDDEDEQAKVRAGWATIAIRRQRRLANISKLLDNAEAITLVEGSRS